MLNPPCLRVAHGRDDAWAVRGVPCRSALGRRHASPQHLGHLRLCRNSQWECWSRLWDTRLWVWGAVGAARGVSVTQWPHCALSPRFGQGPPTRPKRAPAPAPPPPNTFITHCASLHRGRRAVWALVTHAGLHYLAGWV
jgi:hypothetical protein